MHLEHGSHNHDKPMSPQDAVRSLLVLAQVAQNAADYESAAEAYASALEIEPNVVALYNLGSFYARGLGVRQDFVEAARLFHQADLRGNDKAGKLCGKCMFDYAHNDMFGKTPAQLYASMAVFVSRVFPEAANPRLEARNGLLAIASTFRAKGDDDNAERFRLAAEYGNATHGIDS